MEFRNKHTQDKLRGGYYTPIHLAEYVVNWTLQGSSSVLEPSCGDGAFIEAISNHPTSEPDITALDIIKDELDKAEARLSGLNLSNSEFINGDFLSWANQKIEDKNFDKFSSVVGNPPFIKYQLLEPLFQEQSNKIFKRLNLKFTKHTNAWVPFVLSAIELLEDGGRLGMVIPSEIIHVSHAKPLREYLEYTCSRILLIDPEELWFENTLQGALIILAQKKANPNDESEGIAIHQVKGLDFLEQNPDKFFTDANKVKEGTSEGKWTKAILTKKELNLIQDISNNINIYQFNEIARATVAIVTGANKFFLVDDATVIKYGLQAYTRKMFWKGQHCKGVIYDLDQHNSNAENGLPTNFLYIDDKPEDLPASVKKYIKTGEQEGLHKRYKCRIRDPWYKVPFMDSSNLALPKMCHSFPKMIFNELEAHTTDNSFKVSTDIDPTLFAFCFINPLTAIYAELEGRSYGGGVLELVPSEVAKLLVPIPDGLEFDLRDLDQRLQKDKAEVVMKEQGEIIFKALGVSKKEREALFNIWVKLKSRRQRKS